MRYLLQTKTLNPYRSHVPRGFYHWLKGHSGTDQDYHFEELPAPVSGKITAITKQQEMGNVIYLDDIEQSNIHVFAHMNNIKVKVGDHVQRGQPLGITGNTGSKTTAPHLHYEVITFRKPDKKKPTAYDSLFNSVMTRSLNGLVGWNIDPLAYVRILYGKYRLDQKGYPIDSIPPERPINH